VYILEVRIVWSGFENEDFGIEVFSKTTCNDAARCTTTKIVSVGAILPNVMYN
jgi:hypothetical protein